MKLKVERMFKQLEKKANGKIGSRAVMVDSVVDIINYAAMVGMRIGAFNTSVQKVEPEGSD